MPAWVTELPRVFARAFRRPGLVVDIDGVLAFFAEAVATALNARFETAYDPARFTRYWLEDWLPPEQARWLTATFQEPAFYQALAPDLRGIDALRALAADGWTITVVSDRPASCAEVTRRWLARWQVPADRIVLEGPETKARVVADATPERPLIVFDDDPRKQRELPRPGVAVWSPLRPWTPPASGRFNVRVFATWDEVRGWLESEEESSSPN